MAAQPEGMAHSVHHRYDEQQVPSRPKISQRKSSFSEALTKFTSNTFNRRRTNTGIPSSTSSIDINHQSRIPTPAGIDRSTSFFSTLNTFASKSTASTSEESPRKISERLAQTPFFSHQHQQQSAVTPRNNRESSVKIEQRGLMQPVHPPLPRSNTIGILGQSPGSSPHTPGFMRPTTSSARRSSAMGRSDTAAPSSMAGRGSAAIQRQKNHSLRTIAGSNTPNKTPTQARQVPAARFPTRSDSLASTPRLTGEPVPAVGSETVPADHSDGANFQISDQLAPEMGTAKEESTSTKTKASTDFIQEARRVPPTKESQKGILKSRNKHRELSNALSNLYVDDEPDSSKEEHDGDETKARSDRGTPEYSERTASPKSSNPRLVSDRSPLTLIPLHPLLTVNYFLKLPHSFPSLLPANAPPPPPDPRSPIPNMVARPLHRALRPFPHRRPPLPFLIALQVPIPILPLTHQQQQHNRHHLRIQLQRKPPHAQPRTPQPPRVHPPALPLHDGRSAREPGHLQSDDGSEGGEDGGGAAGENREGEARVVGRVDGEGKEEGGEVI